MWFLTRKNDGMTVYLIEQEYIFGRGKDETSNCHVTLAEDISISRKHLKLMAKYSSTEGLNEPVLKVMDLGSTYGTYINPTNEISGKIKPNTWVDLKEGSLLQFGAKNHWLVKWHDIIVVCSALGITERRKMIDTVTKLGGLVAVDWRGDFTHLAIGVIKMTSKVIGALISAKPLVSCEYFEAWKAVLNTNPQSHAPDIKDYIPDIDPTPMLRRFDKIDYIPKESRKTLFLGKTFLFPTKSQYDSMASSIEKAGGKSTMDLQHDDEGNQIILVGTSDTSVSTEEYLTCLKKSKDRGHRAISMKEILLAIIAGSTLRYCNSSIPTLGEVDQQIPIGPGVASLCDSSLSERSHVHDSDTIEKTITKTDKDRGEPPSKKKRNAVIQETQTLNETTQLTQRDFSLTDKCNDPEIQDKSKMTSLLASTLKQPSGNKLKRKQLTDLEIAGTSSMNENYPIQVYGTTYTSSVEICQPDNKRAKLVETNPVPPLSIGTKSIKHPEKEISMFPCVSVNTIQEKNSINKDIIFDQTMGYDQSRYSRTFNDSTTKMMKIVPSFRRNASLPISTSQNTQVKDITRIRLMKIMTRKDGKWIKH